MSIARKATVSGTLLPAAGLIEIRAQQGGTITARHGVEGKLVNAGDTLFVLRSERVNLAYGDSAKAAVAALNLQRLSLNAERDAARRQAQQRGLEAQRRVVDWQAEIGRIAVQKGLGQQRLVLAQAAVDREERLQQAQFVSASHVQAKLAELLDRQQGLADLERASAAAERELAGARSALRESEWQAARDEAEFTRRLSALGQEIAESESRREELVRAPAAGIVSNLTAEAGQYVATGKALATIQAASADLVAERYARSRDIGFIKTGMSVRLRYAAYPHQKFGQHAGTVIEVSRSALPRDALAGVAPTEGEPLYRVRVKLAQQAVLAYGERLPLRAGMVVEASVLLESRRLWEWVLDPLRSVSGKV